jgi:NAD(P)H dehydrogenase (quinone)
MQLHASTRIDWIRAFALFGALLVLVLCSLPAASLAADKPVTVLIAYFSKGGATAAMAKAVEEGARTVRNTAVVLKTIDKVTTDDLLGADAIIVGSPVYNGGMAGEVKSFIDGWPFGRLKEKVGAAFCAAGGTSAGEELTMMSILQSMLIFQFVIVGGDSWQAAFGASAVTEEGKPQSQRGVADAAARAKARALGVRVARLANVIRKGSS